MRRFINIIQEASEWDEQPNPFDDSIWYRGTKEPGWIGIGDARNGDMLGQGFYLTNDPEYAAKFGPHIDKFQVSLGAVLRHSNGTWPRDRAGRELSGKLLSDFARQNGFDAILDGLGSGVFQLCVLDTRLIELVEDD